MPRNWLRIMRIHTVLVNRYVVSVLCAAAGIKRGGLIEGRTPLHPNVTVALVLHQFMCLEKMQENIA